MQIFIFTEAYETLSYAAHCEAGEGNWLQGEAALQTHSFRDADPRPVIPKNRKLLELFRNRFTKTKHFTGPGVVAVCSHKLYDQPKYSNQHYPA